MPVKQCMPEGMQIEVETIDLDNQSADEPMRTKRWLFNVRTVYSFTIIMITSFFHHNVIFFMDAFIFSVL